MIRSISNPEDLFRLDSAEHDGPIEIGETEFAFFQRSTHPHAVRARVILNAWFRAYPNRARSTLRKRIQSKPPHAFDSSVFELYVHALLRACGFDVEVNDVAVPEQGRQRPDFLASEPSSKRRYYVEATVVRGSQQDRSLDAQLYQLNWYASRHVRESGFAVGLRRRGIQRGEGNISPRAFATFLNEWFRDSRAPDASEERTYRHAGSGWTLPLRLIRLENPGKRLDQVIAIQTGAARWSCEGVDVLRKELNSKRRKYKRLDAPLVVAVACNDFVLQLGPEEMREALVGTGCDSVWRRRGGDVRRAPIGVLYVNGCYASGLQEAAPCLWENPSWAEQLRPWPLPRTELRGDALTAEHRPGQRAATLLRIES